MRVVSFIVLTLSIAGVVAAIFLYHFREHTYRYKITVEIDTPQGMRSGYAVREITWRRLPSLTVESRSSKTRQKGEAVMVDLPDNQLLFVLLDVEAYMTVYSVFRAVGGGSVKEMLDKAALTKSQYITLDANSRSVEGHNSGNYPRMVVFSDLNNPQSVRNVSPKNLSAQFGLGFGLRRIVAQVTDEWPTYSIRNKLPWLKTLGEGQLNGDRFEDFRKTDLAAHLSPFAFTTEPGR